MRRLKELTINEKLLLISAIILLIAIGLKWPKIKVGIEKGWNRFGIEFPNKKD